MRFFIQVIGVGLSLMVTDALMKGIEIDGITTALFAAIILIIMNAIVKPVITLLTLPVTILTLGLFLFVVNALTYWWTSNVIDGFSIDTFWSAIFGAIITSLISTFIQKQG